MHIVLKAPKSAGAKVDVTKIYEFVHVLHPRECVSMDVTGAPADFEAFSTIETRRCCGPKLSSIEQTAPADPNS